MTPDLTWLNPLSDDALLSLTIYGEARGEPLEGQIAVACCVRNRRRDPDHRWGETYRAVCLQPSQFSCWSPAGGVTNHDTVLQAARSLLTKADVVPLLDQAAWVALGISRGAILDTVRGANHYHTASLVPRPAWTKGRTPLLQKGGHVFYRL